MREAPEFSRSGASIACMDPSPAPGGCACERKGEREEFDAIMAALKAKGATFERYPHLGMTMDGDVHTDGTFKAAWFKDPDGNILHINNE